MRRMQIGAQVQSLFQRRNRTSKIVVFKVGLSQADKSLGDCRFELRDLTVFRDGSFELPILLRLSASLHMLQGLRRRALQREKEHKKGRNHGFSGSTTSRNWSACTSFK